MKNSLLLTIAMIFLFNSLYAQERQTFKGPVVYLELGGPSSTVTRNVEYGIWKLPRWYVNARAGIGYAIVNGVERSGYPIGLHLFQFAGNHHGEIGGGLSYIEGIERYWSAGEAHWNRGLYGYATLAYRYQRPSGGMFFRAAWNPLFQIKEYNPDPLFRYGEASPYWWGLSAGYAFNIKKKKTED